MRNVRGTVKIYTAAFLIGVTFAPEHSPSK
jgi:hypothetical protein